MNSAHATYHAKPQSVCGAMWSFVVGKRRIHFAARERGSA
jgi:hypothetical protein